MLRLLALVLPALWLGNVPAQAVIVASGDGTQNTTAPADDPGFANVGVKGGLSVVYLGNRWVVTAAHVGMGTVTFGGVPYAAIPGTLVSFETSPGKLADLIAFKLREDPGLPTLAIASTTPPAGSSVNSSVVMIGHGRDRGASTQWTPPPPPQTGPIDGWLWGPGYAMRWGTNLVGGAPTNVTIGSNVSRAFWTDFTNASATASEAQAAEGDSGGALFVKPQSVGSWQLAGVLFAIGAFSGQPASSALYGNVTYALDLAFYRSAILAVTTRPACNDGIEDDGDGLVDFPNDPGCSSATDLDERSPLLPCDDGADDDGDGLADYPADPGCKDPAWTRENPACDDGIDNDGDGAIDWDGGATNGKPDARCVATGSWQMAEAPGCGLGVELVALIPLLARWRRRRRAD